MSDETCDDCGRQYAKTLNQYRGGQFCGRELTPGYEEARSCDRERNCFAYGLERTKSQLAETSQRLEQAERVIEEYRAWDATVQELHPDSLTEALERYDTERAKFTSVSGANAKHRD